MSNNSAMSNDSDPNFLTFVMQAWAGPVDRALKFILGSVFLTYAIMISVFVIGCSEKVSSLYIPSEATINLIVEQNDMDKKELIAKFASEEGETVKGWEKNDIDPIYKNNCLFIIRKSTTMMRCTDETLSFPSVKLYSQDAMPITHNHLAVGDLFGLATLEGKTVNESDWKKNDE
jgi:hypothetical protein